MIFFQQLHAYCKKNDYKSVQEYFDNDKYHIDLNRNHIYSMGASFLLPLPLVEATLGGAKECVNILLAQGADPDVVCKKRGKSAREIAPELF